MVKASRFTQCAVCQRLTAQINDRSIGMDVKLAAVKTYRQHLHDQYIDRSACWAIQELSCDHQSGCLVILLDGIDQAKFSIPRDKGLRQSASLSHCSIELHFSYLVFGSPAYPQYFCDIV